MTILKNIIDNYQDPLTFEELLELLGILRQAAMLHLLHPPLYYLASPHTDKSHAVQQMRWEQVVDCAAALHANGEYVFCPIAHDHHIAIEMKKTWSTGATNFSFWGDYDKYMISLCDVLFVFMIDGWKESVGVTAEIEFADEKNIPIIYFHPNELYRRMHQMKIRARRV